MTEIKISLDTDEQQVVFDAFKNQIEYHTKRVKKLDKEISGTAYSMKHVARNQHYMDAIKTSRVDTKFRDAIKAEQSQDMITQ